MVAKKTIIRADRICKHYGGVEALRNVSLELDAGEIHALCGENGAGKSTLIGCLAGVIRPTRGSLTIHGSRLALGDVRTAESAGISVIHQESTAFPDLDAVDNIFVGHELRKWPGLFLDRTTMRRHAVQLLDRLEARVDLETPLRGLSVADRQFVAMARALSHNCQLLIMDEPTASLSARESKVLLNLCRRLRGEGVTILYVSHRLEEVFDIADRVTVLRDGELVATNELATVDRMQLIRWMVGRDIAPAMARDAAVQATDDRLSVKALCGEAFRDVSFSIRGGEVLGLAGLIGSGRSEVARAVFGIDAYHAGEVRVDGMSVPKANVSAAIRLGMALVPEDRQHEGLVLPMNVTENLSLAVLDQLTTPLGIVKRKTESELAHRYVADLNVKVSRFTEPAQNLSGGNQQKLVIGKWLARQPRVLLLDEPTRGVDVGAKAQVHNLIQRLSCQGMATLVISSEVSELLHLCDRILVMCEGRMRGELPGSASPEAVLSLALPGDHRTT